MFNFVEVFKFIIFFFGSGVICLIAFYVFQDANELLPRVETETETIKSRIKRELKAFTKLISSIVKYKTNYKLKVTNKTSVSPSSAFYMISFKGRKPIKIFSSPKGMRAI